MKITEEHLTANDYGALAKLRYTLRQFTDFSASAALEEGVPSQQHQALLAIKAQSDDDPLTIGMLARRLIVTPQTATELVGRLCEAGLVCRNCDPIDRRRQQVELTEKAEDLLARLSSVHLREIRELAPELIGILQRLQKEH